MISRRQYSSLAIFIPLRHRRLFMNLPENSLERLAHPQKTSSQQLAAPSIASQINSTTRVSGRSFRTGHLWLTDKVLKKSPVMNHRLAQFFRAGLSQCLAKRDSVGCSVIFHNQWMVH